MKHISILILISLGFNFIYGENTLAKVQERGQLICGVNKNLVGFSSADSKGKYHGMDVDYCKALATAVLGDPNKVKFIPLIAKERFISLQRGEIDILSRNTSWTLTRDASLGINFAGIMYYDGQGFLVKKSLKITSVKQLKNVSVCLQSGTSTESNINDYFQSNKIRYEIIKYDTPNQTRIGLEKGLCDVLTSDNSQLYALKSSLKNPSDYIQLPEIISKKPLGPVVRHGDDRWLDIAKWVIYALLEAEEQGVTQENVSKKQKSRSPFIRRLLGEEGNTGKSLGLDKKWAFNVIKAVGNYGEIFERNVGEKTPLGIKRGQNALWKNGGLMYSMPVR